MWCECFVASSVLFACSVGDVRGQVWMCRSVYPSYPCVQRAGGRVSPRGRGRRVLLMCYRWQSGVQRSAFSGVSQCVWWLCQGTRLCGRM